MGICGKRAILKPSMDYNRSRTRKRVVFSVVVSFCRRKAKPSPNETPLSLLSWFVDLRVACSEIRLGSGSSFRVKFKAFWIVQRSQAKKSSSNQSINVDVWSSKNCMHSLPLIVAYNFLRSTRQLFRALGSTPDTCQ